VYLDVVSEEPKEKHEIKELLAKQHFTEMIRDVQLSQLRVFRESIDESLLTPKQTIPPQDPRYNQLAASLKLHHQSKPDLDTFTDQPNELAICSRVEFCNGIQFATRADGSLLVVDSQNNSRFNKWVLAENTVKTYTTQAMSNYGRDLAYQNNTLYFLSRESALMQLPLPLISKSSLEFKLRCNLGTRNPHYLEDPTGIDVWREKFFKPTRAINARCSHFYSSGLNDHLLFTTESGELGRYLPQPDSKGRTSMLIRMIFEEEIVAVAEGFGTVFVAATNQDHSRMKLAVLETDQLRKIAQTDAEIPSVSPLVTASISLHNSFRLLAVSTAIGEFMFFTFFQDSIHSLFNINTSFDKLLLELPRAQPEPAAGRLHNNQIRARIARHLHLPPYDQQAEPQGLIEFERLPGVGMLNRPFEEIRDLLQPPMQGPDNQEVLQRMMQGLMRLNRHNLQHPNQE